MVVVVPVDADEREAQHVDQESREPLPEIVEGRPRRRPQLEHHDGDDHGHHPVAERLQPVGLLLGRGACRSAGGVVHVAILAVAGGDPPRSRRATGLTPNRRAVSCLTPTGKPSSASRRRNAASAVSAAASPSNAARQISGSAFASPRIAPAAPSARARCRILVDPTKTLPSQPSTSAASRSGSPLLSFTPATGRLGRTSSSIPGADIAGKW